MELWRRHGSVCPGEATPEDKLPSSYIPVPTRLISCFNASARLCTCCFLSSPPPLSPVHHALPTYLSVPPLFSSLLRPSSPTSLITTYYTSTLLTRHPLTTHSPRPPLPSPTQPESSATLSNPSTPSTHPQRTAATPRAPDWSNAWTSGTLSCRSICSC